MNKYLVKVAESLAKMHSRLDDPSYARMAGKSALYGIGGAVVGNLAGGALTSPLRARGGTLGMAGHVLHEVAHKGGLTLGAYQGAKSSAKNQLNKQVWNKFKNEVINSKYEAVSRDVKK